MPSRSAYILKGQDMKDKIQMWIVWKLPRWMIKLAGIRMIFEATTGEYSTTIVPELTAMEAVKRWKP